MARSRSRTAPVAAPAEAPAEEVGVVTIPETDDQPAEALDGSQGYHATPAAPEEGAPADIIAEPAIPDSLIEWVSPEDVPADDHEVPSGFSDIVRIDH